MRMLFTALLIVSAALDAHAEVAAHTGTKYDTQLPIEISANSLEVLQHENKAIFKGNVIAVQGQVRLNADTMTVHYKQKSGSPSPTPAPAAAPATDATAGAMGAITKIDVDGNVFVATPEESARGETGNYDVESKMLHLFGSNVVLTRDKNILRGTALEYNMATGRSLLTNGGGPVTAGTGAAPANGGRVRGVFVPQQSGK